VNVSFLQEILNSVAERGRHLLPRALVGSQPAHDITDLARALVSGSGEASGVALARQFLARYRELPEAERRALFLFLAESLGPDLERVRTAASAFLAAGDARSYARLAAAVEPPRQEFFRRLNLAPGATAEIVALRRDLIEAMAQDARLAPVDGDLVHLLGSWFNRGFLVLRRIDWSTPANILEKIIEYEAVHEIQGWDDLRRRLDPHDRRCFGFFHPSLVDEPLIFVEVALTREIPGSIQGLLTEAPRDGREKPPAPPTTAVFYSISNCQEGLKGISFGNFLIKQVVEELARELPSLKAFVTLSPVPGFARWLETELTDDVSEIVSADDRVRLQLLKDSAWTDEEDEDLSETLLALAAHYFLLARQTDGRPIDPVARFHLGNGARLERINLHGDLSEKGLREAHGLMVNYLYELKEIERNHEAYANEGLVAAARSVRSLLRPQEKARAAAEPAGRAAQPAPGSLRRTEPARLPPPPADAPHSPAAAPPAEEEPAGAPPSSDAATLLGRRARGAAKGKDSAR
jgi:malonyl-CoA decarboxylase